jgi:kynurenine formamidase
VLRGVRAVKQGKVFTCGEQIGQSVGDPMWPGRAPTSRVNVRDKSYYDDGRVKAFPGGVEYADDQMTMFLQGSTQFDALGHVWYDNKIWNGYPASATVGGMAKASAYKGKFALDKGDLLGLEDLLGAAKKQGVTIEKRDIVCLRIGFLQLRLKQSQEQFYKDFNEPGLTYSPELVDWFNKMEIPALCTDTISNECELDPDVGVQIPLHCALMRNLGIAFNEICNFEELAPDCHKDGQWDFLYVAAPLKVVDATGSPVNVIAIK